MSILQVAPGVYPVRVAVTDDDAPVTTETSIVIVTEAPPKSNCYLPLIHRETICNARQVGRLATANLAGLFGF